MKIAIRRGACLMAGLAMASCASATQPEGRQASLAGTNWAVTRLAGQRAPTGRRPAATIHFAPGGAIDGTVACNDVGSGSNDWTANGGFIRHPERPSIITTVGCLGEDRQSAFGGLFWNRMDGAVSWARTGDRLTIRFEDDATAELRRLRHGTER